ncbi:MAG: HD domain-containing protein [Celeribacter sp.]
MAQGAPDPVAGQPDLTAQLRFLVEADRLKAVLRASRLCDGSRYENSAEHSWHAALYALTLMDQAGPDVQIDRVIRMLLLHDLVEIDAGDTPIHLGLDPALQEAAEQAAADRLFGLLPSAQGAEFRALWDEFEAAESPDAVFAKALDRVVPLLQNLANDGGSWLDYDVRWSQIVSRVGDKVARGAPDVWAHVAALVRPWFAVRGRDDLA